MSYTGNVRHLMLVRDYPSVHDVAFAFAALLNATQLLGAT